MIYKTSRPLTGPLSRSSPAVRLGRRPLDSFFYPYRDRWVGQPAVSVDLRAPNKTLTFETPEELEEFAAELISAANYLYEMNGEKRDA